MSDARQPDATTPHAPADSFAGETVGPPNGEPVAPSVPVRERYALGAEIARGGMAIVHTAADLAFGREVAVKVLSAELSGSEADRRFVYEARITGQLQHPSIPPVHDLGMLPDGRPFLAMKLIRGHTLAREVESRPFVPDEFDHYAGVFEQICLAVAFAHSKGIIHRDLKPANVMVGAFGEVQVMDWGLAKELESGPARGEVGAVTADDIDGEIGPDDRTRAGAVMGTPAYMAPEQARGEKLDERADVFALGGILCAILTGKPPYLGRSAREVWQKAAAAELSDALERLAAVKDAGQLPAIARRCLAADPRRRFAHAGEVRAAIDAARNKAREVRKQYDLSLATTDADRLQRRADLRARNAVLVGLAGLALGLLSVGGAFLYADHVKARATADMPKYTDYQKELFPTLVVAAHKHADDGLFDPGFDRSGRDRVAGLLHRCAAALDPPEAAHANLLLYGLFELAREESTAGKYWDHAVGQYGKVEPDHAEATLVVRACDWFTARQSPSKLDRKVLDRLRQALTAARTKPLPGPLREQVEAASAKIGTRKLAELK